MQALIGENMQHLDVAMVDERYIKFCKKKYKKLSDAVEDAKSAAFETPDHDLENHYNNLDRYYTRTSEWKLEPLDNPEHDFITPLLNRYLEDIEFRQRKVT